MAQLIKNLPTNAGDTGNAGSIPGSGSSLEDENHNPVQYSCMKNPMDWVTWWTTIQTVAKSQMTGWLHTHTYTPWEEDQKNWVCIYTQPVINRYIGYGLLYHNIFLHGPSWGSLLPYFYSLNKYFFIDDLLCASRSLMHLCCLKHLFGKLEETYFFLKLSYFGLVH